MASLVQESMIGWTVPSKSSIFTSHSAHSFSSWSFRDFTMASSMWFCVDRSNNKKLLDCGFKVAFCPYNDVCVLCDAISKIISPLSSFLFSFIQVHMFSKKFSNMETWLIFFFPKKYMYPLFTFIAIFS